jgi:hypothetical protein
MKSDKKNSCIDPARVPCEKARAYLEKKGLLCGSKVAVKTKKKKGILEDWFG